MANSRPDHLPLMESFHTIQGEGVFTGQASFFIRLGGCDVGCVWCDVKDSWDASRHPLVSVVDMVSNAKKSGAPIAVVTGGEPAMHPLELLTAGLKSAGIRTHIETSGACEITGEWDWVCLSPKKFKLPVPSSYQKANELKVIVYHKSDLEWALEQASKVGPECILLLQPEWSREKEMTTLIVDFVKKHQNWRISLQTHKYMNIP
ncbi:MAG: radical SAM protein [Bacteroidetes bacterium]|nr:radical SAM protein [Bacteroidota bacterium]